jgi:hypothetical protein
MGIVHAQAGVPSDFLLAMLYRHKGSTASLTGPKRRRRDCVSLSHMRATRGWLPCSYFSSTIHRCPRPGTLN